MTTPSLNADSLSQAFIAVAEFAQQKLDPKQYPFQYKSGVCKGLNRPLKTHYHNRASLENHGKDKEPLYVVNIPFTPSKELDSKKWIGLTRIIQEESFGCTAEESIKAVSRRLFVTIGMNRSASIDKQDDEDFYTWVRSLRTDKLHFQCRVISTLWQTAFTNGGHFQSAQISYLMLEYLDLDIAKKVKQHLFAEISRTNLRQQIPFQYIREWVWKDTTAQAALIPTLQRRITYLTIMDDDAVAFRKPGDIGVFSASDQIVEGHSETLPQLMSTGYYAASDVPLLTQLGVVIDMDIRGTVSRHIQGGVYLPEPGTSVLLNIDAIRDAISFIGRESQVKLDSENRRMISHIRPYLDPSRIHFKPVQSLFTFIPGRMEASKKREELNSKSLGAKEVLKSLRGISQTHADHLILSNNVFLALPPGHGLKRQIFNSYFSKLLISFDFISFVCFLPPDTTYSYYRFEIARVVFALWSEYLYLAYKSPKQADGFKNAWAQRTRAIALSTGEKRSMGKQAATEADYKAAFQGQLEIIRNTLALLEKESKLTAEWREKLLITARDAGRAIHKAINSHVKN